MRQERRHQREIVRHVEVQIDKSRREKFSRSIDAPRACRDFKAAARSYPGDAVAGDQHLGVADRCGPRTVNQGAAIEQQVLLRFEHRHGKQDKKQCA